MEKLLSDAYINEIKNVLFYSSLSTECSKKSLMGFAKFFKNQSDEEYEHSKKLLNHLVYHKINIYLDINYNELFFYDNYLDVSLFVDEILKKSLKREKEGSKNFEEIMKYIENNKMYKHQDIILWFINEQVEEENFFSKLIQKFKNSTVYLLDKELNDT